MKVKLFKIYANKRTVSFEHDDYTDYNDIIRHTVKEYSDWEEIDDNQFHYLKEWVESAPIIDGFKYILAIESEMSCESKIKEIIKKRDAEIKAYEEREKKEEKKRQIEKEKRKEKELERLKKKLAKLQEKEKEMTANNQKV